MKHARFFHFLLTIGIAIFLPSCSEKSAPPGTSVVSKGEIYRAIDDQRTVKIISGSEMELSEGRDHFAGQYSRDGGRLRATVEMLGTKRVLYFDFTSDGLRDEEGNVLYGPERFEAVMREVQAKRALVAANERLLKAAQESDLAGTIAALQSGAQVNASDSWQNSALHLACVAGSPDVVKLLLDKGADPNAKNAKSAGANTPLHIAASSTGRKYEEIIRLLLAAHADVNAQNQGALITGLTPLMGAVLGGNAEASKLLVEAGADRSIKNGDRMTAFDYARDIAHDMRLLRTTKEAEIFKESRIQTKEIGAFKHYDYTGHRMRNDVALTDVGILYSRHNIGEKNEAEFFGNIQGDPKTDRFRNDTFGFGGYSVKFSENLVIIFKEPAERDAFYQASVQALGEWREKFPGVW